MKRGCAMVAVLVATGNCIAQEPEGNAQPSGRRTGETYSLDEQGAKALLAVAVQLSQELNEHYLRRKDLLTELGVALLGLGEEDAALQVGGSQEDVAREVALRRAARGDRQGALAAIESLTFGRRVVLAEISERIERARVVCLPPQEALAAVGEIRSPERHFRAALALGQRWGHAEGALEALRSASSALDAILDPRARLRLTGELVELHLKRGEREIALGVIRRTEETLAVVEEVWPLEELGVLYGTAGRREDAARVFELAIQIAESHSASERELELAEISGAQARAGMLEEALVSAGQVRGGCRGEALYRIGVAQILAGKLMDAVETAQCVKDYTQYRDELLFEAIQGLAARGDTKVALEHTDGFSCASTKVAAILAVASSQLERGDRDGAYETARTTSFLGTGSPRTLLAGKQLGPRFDFLRPATWHVPYEDTGLSSAGLTILVCRERSRVVRAVARFYFSLGEVDCVALAEGLDGADEGVIHDVALIHGRLGNVKCATRWIEHLTDKRSRAWATLGLVEGLLSR